MLGVSFAIGQFWFAWTGYKASIHWIAPTLSGLASGFGLMSIFLQCLVSSSKANLAEFTLQYLAFR